MFEKQKGNLLALSEYHSTDIGIVLEALAKKEAELSLVHPQSWSRRLAPPAARPLQETASRAKKDSESRRDSLVRMEPVRGPQPSPWSY